MDMKLLSTAVSDFGFPIIMAVGMGYFVYYVWWFINNKINVALGTMHKALIRVIDQTRMMDQDLIRLQQKVNVVLEYREKEAIIEDQKEKEALEILEEKKQ